MEPPCLWKINVCAHLYGPQYENYGLGQILKYDMVLFMKFEQRRIESITRAKSSVMPPLQYKYQREMVRGAYSQDKIWCGCTINNMAIGVVEFSREGYKIRKDFA